MAYFLRASILSTKACHPVESTTPCLDYSDEPNVCAKMSYIPDGIGGHRYNCYMHKSHCIEENVPCDIDLPACQANLTGDCYKLSYHRDECEKSYMDKSGEHHNCYMESGEQGDVCLERRIQCKLTDTTTTGTTHTSTITTTNTATTTTNT